MVLIQKANATILIVKQAKRNKSKSKLEVTGRITYVTVRLIPSPNTKFTGTFWKFTIHGNCHPKYYILIVYYLNLVHVTTYIGFF